VDWSLSGCARTRHVTYAPDEAEVRDRLMAPATGGTAWRCLRCGAFVTARPHGSGPAETARQEGEEDPERQEDKELPAKLPFLYKAAAAIAAWPEAAKDMLCTLLGG